MTNILESIPFWLKFISLKDLKFPAEMNLG